MEENYFEKVYPEIDTERVYASDMKKMITWFAVLQKHNIDYTVKEEPQEEVAVAIETETAAPVTEAPVKKAASKSAKKQAIKKPSAEVEEAPAEKKAPAKTKKKKTGGVNGES